MTEKHEIEIAKKLEQMGFNSLIINYICSNSKNGFNEEMKGLIENFYNIKTKMKIIDNILKNKKEIDLLNTLDNNIFSNIRKNTYESNLNNEFIFNIIKCFNKDVFYSINYDDRKSVQYLKDVIKTFDYMSNNEDIITRTFDYMPSNEYIITKTSVLKEYNDLIKNNYSFKNNKDVKKILNTANFLNMMLNLKEYINDSYIKKHILDYLDRDKENLKKIIERFENEECKYLKEILLNKYIDWDTKEKILFSKEPTTGVRNQKENKYIFKNLKFVKNKELVNTAIKNFDFFKEHVFKNKEIISEKLIMFIYKIDKMNIKESKEFKKNFFEYYLYNKKDKLNDCNIDLIEDNKFKFLEICSRNNNMFEFFYRVEESKKELYGLLLKIKNINNNLIIENLLYIEKENIKPIEFNKFKEAIKIFEKVDGEIKLKNIFETIKESKKKININMSKEHIVGKINEIKIAIENQNNNNETIKFLNNLTNKHKHKP